MSLPLQREYISVKLGYASLLLSMLSLHIHDERRAMVDKLQKPAVLQVTVVVITDYNSGIPNPGIGSVLIAAS